MIEGERSSHHPSDFPLPEQWESLLPLPIPVAAESISQTGTAPAKAGLQHARDSGLRIAATELNSDRVLWALAARLPKLQSWLSSKGQTSTPTIKLDELSWSVACEQLTDEWPKPDQHAKHCEDSFNDEYERDGLYLRQFIRSRYRDDGTYLLSEDDIEQATWMAMHRYYWSMQAKSRFLGLSTLRTKLYRIAIQTMLRARSTHQRGRGRSPHLPAENVQDSINVSADWLPPESQEELARVWQLVDRLPAGQKQVFEMRYGQGMSVTEVARALGTSAANVVQQLDRAVEKIRAWLGEQ